MSINRILVTGANGFIGNDLCRTLKNAGYTVRGLIRSVQNNENIKYHCDELKEVGDLDDRTEWESILTDIDVIVHLAARVHVLHDESADPLAEFKRVNCNITEQLARNAAKHSVKRFIYISTIGVNGNCTSVKPFTENNSPQPYNAYSISKWQAERVLRLIEKETDLKVTILRPPLVYGHTTKGNFFKLLRLVDMNIPLPFGSIDNKRSMIAIQNLVDIIVRCIEHPNAISETFLVSDGEDISTPELIRCTAKALGKKAKLIPFPPCILQLAANIIGKGDIAQRVLCSLQVDSSKVRQLLGWKPLVSVDEGIERTATWYRNEYMNK